MVQETAPRVTLALSPKAVVAVLNLLLAEEHENGLSNSEREAYIALASSARSLGLRPDGNGWWRPAPPRDRQAELFDALEGRR